MVDVTLIAGDGEAVIESADPSTPLNGINPGLEALLTTDPRLVTGTFKSLGGSGAGTTEFLTSPSNGSLLITDMILSADKVNSGAVEVRITDGTNSEPMARAIVTDAPVNMAANFGGRFQTWRNARVDVVVTNAVTWNLTLGYTRVATGLEYSDWNNRR